MMRALPGKALAAACRQVSSPASAAVMTSTGSPAVLWSSRQYGAFSRSIPALEVLDMKVPTMGDSITEGTIVEWTAQVGQLVKEGDVIALIETDKVTVDIKAEVDGVVVAHFGGVDDNIEVGADLYRIDTEATESEGGFFAVAASDEEGEGADAIETVAEVVAAEKEEADSGGGAGTISRVPSIKFLGKDGWAKKKLTAASAPSFYDQSPQADIAPGGVVTVAATYLGPAYGRPAFTEREMEALISGGADEVPKLISRSSGAVFGP